MAKPKAVRPGPQASYAHISWSELSASDHGEAVKSPSAMTVQFSGDFDGATAVLEGSLNGDDFFPLTDVDRVIISATAALLTEVQQDCMFYRVVVTGGGDATSINVDLVGRG